MSSAGLRRIRRFLFPAIGLVALLAVPLIADPFQVTLVARGLVWATLAVSVWFLLRICNLPSLGHAAFFGIGAYTAGLAVTRWHVGNVFVALALAVGVTAVLAVPIALIASRMKSVSFILITLAFAEMTRSLVMRWRTLGGTDGLVGVTRPHAWPFRVDLADPHNYFYFAVAVLLACIVLLVVVVRSPFGSVLVGVRDSESRMAALGYNPFGYRVAGFMLSATVAGVAGVLHVYLNRFANPTDVAPLISARALLIVVVGGTAITGPITFAIVLTVIEDALSSRTDRWLGLLGVMYILVALFQGSIPRPRWPARRPTAATTTIPDLPSANGGAPARQLVKEPA